MVIVDRLLAAQGSARGILGLPTTGLVNWTDAGDLARFEVIRGIGFDSFFVAGVEVGLNFVECGFEQCIFKNLKTNRHFWGAEDRWTECVFAHCNLHGMIAPLNFFEKCRFEEVRIVNFKPHQTVFDGCSFSRGAVEGLKAQLISNSQMVNRELKGSGGQLLFRECRFKEINFRECYFEGVVFQRCSFENTESSGCSFDGIVSDFVWWGAQKADPFTVFLNKALDLIGGKCGRNSSAYREFESYVIDYGSGKTTNKDFSACLYNNRVPYAETQKIIKDLRMLVASFPF